MTETRPRSSGGPLGVIRRITSSRPEPFDGERCEMCGQPIADAHQHVVDLERRSLMCTCRGCYLLFSSETARQRYRAVPSRYLSFPDFELGPGQWDALEIPVGLAFFFRNSQQDGTFAFYPGPAGATESELPLDAWDTIVSANPGLAVALPDVEALLIRSSTAANSDPAGDCHLVPIDACYELVGRLRTVWRGFDGGQDARTQIAEFFDDVAGRSRPATAIGGDSR